MSAAEKMKSAISRVSRAFVGRRQLIRGGRFLMNSGMMRGPNDPQTNGEFQYLAAILETKQGGGSSTVVLDIGANLGLYSSHAAELMAGKGRLIAAEPCHDTLIQLVENTRNLPTDVETLNVAFSDKTGTAQLYVVGAGAGTNSLETGLGDAERVEAVRLTTLDEFIESESLDHVTFIKVDTEGHDYSVLSGAKRSLQQNRIWAMQFEYNWRWMGQRRFLRDVFELIADCDYQLGRVTPAGIEIYENWQPSMETLIEDNYAIIHNDVADQLQLCTPPV